MSKKEESVKASVRSRRMTSTICLWMSDLLFLKTTLEYNPNNPRWLSINLSLPGQPGGGSVRSRLGWRRTGPHSVPLVRPWSRACYKRKWQKFDCVHDDKGEHEREREKERSEYPPMLPHLDTLGQSQFGVIWWILCLWTQTCEQVDMSYRLQRMNKKTCAFILEFVKRSMRDYLDFFFCGVKQEVMASSYFKASLSFNSSVNYR